ncbi:unnamed protein product [Allacma fusca]|uniref:Transmembrane protein 126A n=1 Tax=Allacma fusca TaxID=39272 RepID=A0A8J2KAC1_9HEXA|nr:unnamed protein product [Allacma fusca]
MRSAEDICQLVTPGIESRQCVGVQIKVQAVNLGRVTWKMADTDVTPNAAVTKPRYVVDHFVPVYNKDRVERTVNKTDIWNSIYSWPEKSQVWPLVYAPAITGVMAGLTGCYINNSARSFLYLNQTGFLISYFATTLLPAGTAAIAHYVQISDDIVATNTKCPVCVQVRAACTQIGFGLIYPAVMTPLSLFPILNKMKKSLRMPNLIKNPKDVFKFFGNIFYPMRRTLGYFAAAHMVVSMGITYLEQESYFTNVAPMVRLPQDQVLN